MSDDSDVAPGRGPRKRRTTAIRDESSDSDSSLDTIARPKRKKSRNYVQDSESDSDSSIEIVQRRRVTRLTSDEQSTPESPGSDIIHPRRNVSTLPSSSDSSSYDEFESDWLSDDGNAAPSQPTELNCSTTSGNSGDEERDRCPICLAQFKKQEVGTPESCDHSFCLDCIMEWSKKVRTCPVDRQQFGLILMRKQLNGKVLKQIPVNGPEQQQHDEQQPEELVVEDLTFCEICGSPEGEETMLLCDMCDLGYHMLCLDPPLEEIPDGVWFCPSCTVHNSIERFQFNIRNEHQMDFRRNVTHRVLPRTRHMERVRTNVRNNRYQNQQEEIGNAPTTNRSSQTRRRRRYRRRKPRTKIKIVYETNEATGETVAIETKVKCKRRRKKRRQRRRERCRVAQRSVKGRLAVHLGMCKMRSGGQMLPDVRIPTTANDMTAFQRNEAGIPRLHIFGRPDDLNSISGSDSEVETGLDILVRRRRPNQSDVAALRRIARRKTVIVPNQPTTSNILDSILDMQSKFHSKDAVLSLNKDGSVKIDKKEGGGGGNNNSKNENNRNNRRGVNVNSYRDEYLRQRPNYGNNSNNRSTSPTNSQTSVGSNSGEHTRRTSSENTNNVVTTSTSSDSVSHTSNLNSENAESYSLDPVESSYGPESKKDKEANKSRSNTPTNQNNSDSDLDIYSDIETVSTSRVEDYEKPVTPQNASEPTTHTDDDGNNSDVDLIIDTEKQEDVKEQVSSSVDVSDTPAAMENVQMPHSTTEIQNETVSTANKVDEDKGKYDDEDTDEEGCPNFSIYSTESINLAKSTDLELLAEKPAGEERTEINKTPAEAGTSRERNVEEIRREDVVPQIHHPPTYSKDASSTKKDSLGLYSDSEDEELVKIQPFSTTKIPDPPPQQTVDIAPSQDEEPERSNQPIQIQPIEEQQPAIVDKPTFQLNDIINMTEDISEEERSYTPCLDERKQEGLEGLETELISDEDRNDFDESHEVKTTSDGGDALEINAKESELDFSKPEDFEEGEIVDKLKAKQAEELKKKEMSEKQHAGEENNQANVSKDSETSNTNNVNNQSSSITSNFKKISRNNKERNYRDKDKDGARSKSRDKEDKENKKSKKKEKRKEIERYNVRSIIVDKPRRTNKDKFGRDESRKKSPSRSTRSVSLPRRSRSRSASRERKRRRARTRSRSVDRRRSRSRSRQRKHRSKSRSKKRTTARKSRDRSKKHYRTPSPRRRREIDRRRAWSRSRSHSYSPEMQRLTPSWTPPRLIEQPPRVKPQNLTVILNNDLNKKKKEKKKKDKRKEAEKSRKRKRDKTPPPSKEVFASGNNILVSVSFNKDTGERDVTKRKRDITTDGSSKKARKDKRKISDERKKKKKEMAGVKPVAIIDLDRSPFRELTPAPEDVIVLTDSENNESNDILEKGVCDSSQQVVTPERPQNYSMGPKTPPEPQVKFTLNPKQNQMRAISNPLHEPDELEGDINPEEELEQRLNDSMHKGPNTPPEPPNSPPSSPDAYDPFDPTKSRTPTPVDLVVMSNVGIMSNNQEGAENLDNKDDDKSHTPPVVADIQPADSQSSSTKAMSPEKSSPKTEQHNIGVIINQVIQPQTPTLPQFSNGSMISSTPMNNLITQSNSSSRINILNSTLIAPPTIVSALPQRIVLPNMTKSSPVKVSPNKLPIKSTPIKPMPNVKSQSSSTTTSNKNRMASQKSSQSLAPQDADVSLDFDSPYSPGSSDYEDLFEPPTDKSQQQTGKQAAGANANSANSAKQKSSSKQQSTFDVLFGSSPVNVFQKTKAKKQPNNNNTKYKKGTKTKQVGVKIDEDTLKILDELPNSAVEMQVKDKFVDDWVLSVGPTVVCNKEKLQYLKKLNRQERVVEEVKLVLKPHYNKKHVNKEEYKDILRRAVPKICHNKSGEINPQKIQNLIEAYVKKVRHNKKVTSSSNSVNPQKV